MLATAIGSVNGFISINCRDPRPDYNASLFAPGWEEIQLSNSFRIDEIAKKSVWSPIVFKDGHRHTLNFLYSDWGGIDFDGTWDIGSAKKTFTDTVGFVGTTKSHTEESHRFRVVFRWSERITDLETYVYNIDKLVSDYDGDHACIDGARFFWPCKEIVQVVDDGYLQPVRKLPQNWVPFKQKEFMTLRRYRMLGESMIFPKNVRSWLRGVDVDGSRNNYCYFAAKYLTFWGMEADRTISLILESELPLQNKRSLMEAENAAGNGIRKAKKIISESQAKKG